mmetsp:Transcript_6230/g.22131  ORF Transcript_6230/g.22131 Transcript_6230/m.22131 type:complete len:225 (+) Transcript_6230:2123-2797(+)
MPRYARVFRMPRFSRWKERIVPFSEQSTSTSRNAATPNTHTAILVPPTTTVGIWSSGNANSEPTSSSRKVNDRKPRQNSGEPAISVARAFFSSQPKYATAPAVWPLITGRRRPTISSPSTMPKVKYARPWPASQNSPTKAVMQARAMNCIATRKPGESEMRPRCSRYTTKSSTETVMSVARPLVSCSVVPAPMTMACAKSTSHAKMYALRDDLASLASSMENSR